MIIGIILCSRACKTQNIILIMGAVASLVSGKVSVAQGKNFVYRKLYDQFIRDEPIDDFEKFHTAFLQIITTINAVFPARHFDVPQLSEIKEVYNNWNGATTEEKKQEVFEKFIREKVSMKSVDRSMILAGLAAPPAAMAAKRAGESLPQLKIMKVVPDVLFVPSATLVALVGCKLSTTLNRLS